MKKEVDERLLQLSGDLQAVIQMKIDQNVVDDKSIWLAVKNVCFAR